MPWLTWTLNNFKQLSSIITTNEQNPRLFPPLTNLCKKGAASLPFTRRPLHFKIRRDISRFWAAVSRGMALLNRLLSDRWMTSMLHNFPDHPDYDQRLQDVELAYLLSSDAARDSLAENYVGLPF
mgnify:CR=1 FL=1